MKLLLIAKFFYAPIVNRCRISRGKIVVKVIPRDRLLLVLVVAKRVCAKFLKEQVVRFSGR